MTNIEPGHISGSGRTVQCYADDFATTVSIEYCEGCKRCKPITAKARQQRKQPYVRKENRGAKVK